VTNTYGIRRASPITGCRDGVLLVEDHTHDPLSSWARTSRANYAFASLRKWLPLPDGAALWSPRGEVPPPAPTSLTPSAAAASLDRLSAMLLKQRYLAGEDVSKDAYRALAIAGEAAIGRGGLSAMSGLSRAVLDVLPVRAWRDSRIANHRTFVRAFGEPPQCRVVGHDPTTAPYCIALVFDESQARDVARAHLAQVRIYAAVLWPIDPDRVPGVPPHHVDLSRRMLCLHCDHRYGPEDMERVARIARRALGPR
jgi:hypothetical protein